MCDKKGHDESCKGAKTGKGEETDATTDGGSDNVERLLRGDGEGMCELQISGDDGTGYRNRNSETDSESERSDGTNRQKSVESETHTQKDKKRTLPKLST